MKNSSDLMIVAFFVFSFCLFGAPSCPGPLCVDKNGDGICDQICYDGNGDGVCDDQECGTDTDLDGIGDLCDNCPVSYNPNQVNTDGDDFGDVCDYCPDDSGPAENSGCPEEDEDFDNDGVKDILDNCPNYPNADQANDDSDKWGNLCDKCPDTFNSFNTDSDADGFGDECDNCPSDFNEYQYDDDNDTVGNVCDNCEHNANIDQGDVDGDYVGNVCDNCPNTPNANQVDSDNDGTGDVCEDSDTCASEKVLCVPQEYSTIQSALNAANSYGDQVYITDMGSNYRECVNIHDKDYIEIIGNGMPTIQAPEGQDCVVIGVSSTTDEITMRNLHVLGGDNIAIEMHSIYGRMSDMQVSAWGSDSLGAAVYIYGESQFTISNSILVGDYGLSVHDNSFVQVGGGTIVGGTKGIYADGSASLQLSNVTVAEGGIEFNENSTGRLYNIDIDYTSVGIEMRSTNSIELYNVTIEGTDYAIECLSENTCANMYIRNSILVGGRRVLNMMDDGHPTMTWANKNLLWSDSGVCEFHCSVELVVTWADPMFLYHTHIPSANSPAVDQLDPYDAADNDIRGIDRPVDADQNGSALSDLGAYESKPGLDF